MTQFHDPGQPPSVGHEAQEQRSRALIEAFPDAEFSIEDLLGDGDRVVVRWTFRGTHGGIFNGVPATGRSVTMTGISIYRLAAGKIAEAWSNFDQLGMLMQLGLIPVPGQSR